jgi:roadblock/LC7 domain-containing protein
MVRADVQGRAVAQAAVYNARGVYASAYMASVNAALPVTQGSSYLVKKGDDWIPVNGFAFSDGKAVALTDGDKIPANEWSGLVKLPNS